MHKFRRFLQPMSSIVPRRVKYEGRKKRETIPWEAKDPKPPVIHSAIPGAGASVTAGAELCAATIAAGDGRAPALAGAGWYLSIA